MDLNINGSSTYKHAKYLHVENINVNDYEPLELIWRLKDLKLVLLDSNYNVIFHYPFNEIHSISISNQSFEKDFSIELIQKNIVSVEEIRIACNQDALRLNILKRFYSLKFLFDTYSKFANIPDEINKIKLNSKRKVISIILILFSILTIFLSFLWISFAQ